MHKDRLVEINWVSCLKTYNRYVQCDFPLTNAPPLQVKNL